MLRSLQIGRGIAALMVVLFHLNGSIWGIGKYFPQKFSGLFSFGNAGVQFFFVLSGFIIFLVHAKDIGKPHTFGSFLFKRFVRVYPTYWIVLFLTVPVFFVVPSYGVGDERTFSRIVTSALLLPYSKDPILRVAWTLVHEVMFYAFFSICILKPTLGKWLFAIWQIACIGNTVFGSAEFPYSVLLSANNILFSFGLLTAHLYISWRCPKPGVVACAGILAFFATGLHEVYAWQPLSNDAYVLLFGASSAIAILGACNHERNHGLRTPRFFDVLGSASYSIYLIHFPLLSLAAKVLFATGLAIIVPEPIWFTLILIAVVFAGILFSKLVEMPLISALGKFRAYRASTSVR